MATFGKTDAGSTTTALGADNVWVSSGTPAATGTVTSLTHRMHLSGAGTGNFRGVIYSDNAGTPDALLAVTADQSFTNTTMAEVSANFVGVNQITVNSGTPYWIGINWQDPGGGVTITAGRDATANLRRVANGDTFTGGAANPISSPLATLSGPIACYVTFSTTSIKTVDGLAVASVKTVQGLAIASVKTIDGLA